MSDNNHRFYIENGGKTCNSVEGETFGVDWMSCRGGEKMQGEDMLSGSSNNLQETFSEGAND